MAPKPERTSLTAKAASRVGRRGLILISLGILYLVVGYSVLFQDRELFSPPDPKVLQVLDSRFWGLLWIVCGTIAIVSGLRRRQAPDVIGFSACYVPASVWTIFYGYSWFAYLVTNGEFGNSLAWVSALVWADILVTVRICAGWDDLEDPVRRVPQ